MSALTFTTSFACNMQRGLQDVGDIPLCSRENARHNFHIRRNGQTVLPSEVKYPKHTVGYIDSSVVRRSKRSPPIPE